MTIAEYDLWTEVEACDLRPADLSEAALVLGWETWICLGPIGSRLCIRTWYRTKNEQTMYMACLDDGDGDNRFVQTDSLPEFMDALARWSPIVQAEAVSSFLDDLRRDDGSEDETVNRIVAKALRGWQRLT